MKGLGDHIGGAKPKASQAVDLGLPSGTLWAPWNLGARWLCDTRVYFFCDMTTNKLDTYRRIEDVGLIKLPPIENDDVVAACWDKDWRLPTVEQFEELLEAKNCRWEWRGTLDDNGCYCIHSLRNKESLILPVIERNGKPIEASEKKTICSCYMTLDEKNDGSHSIVGVLLTEDFKAIKRPDWSFDLSIRPVLAPKSDK